MIKIIIISLFLVVGLSVVSVQLESFFSAKVIKRVGKKWRGKETKECLHTWSKNLSQN